MSDYELETSWTIWDNKHGTKIVVKPDGDGLGLIEIVCSETNELITVNYEMARLLSAALLNAAAQADVKEGLGQ